MSSRARHVDTSRLSIEQCWALDDDDGLAGGKPVHDPQLSDIIEEQSVDRWQSRTQKQRSDEDQTSKIKMFVVDKVLAKYVVQQAFVE